jgi:hypothetical protein
LRLACATIDPKVLALLLLGSLATPALPGDCLQAVGLDPPAGQGDAAVFEATYRHCDGASSFRIVQLWVGDEVVATIPRVNLGYEAGRFTLEGAGDCAPGDAVVLAGEYGSFDCAASSVMAAGPDMIVNWALEFDVATFAGVHGVFFDAKGGIGDPEPRLGWTQMGTFDVEPSGTGSTGMAADSSGSDGDGTTTTTTTTSAATDEGSSADSEQTGLPLTGNDRGVVPGGGCACAAAEAANLPALLFLVLARRRARQPPCAAT